ncbi:ammonium transporter [Agromyces sp. CF514]|uniref:ammonium transporter n=1 Tax=Agromyces sp. CF514 TaxID=1881031 RepID=UPI0008F3BE30|nr:ammonium transporter [Agromyces sp. CF514]SFR66834.1 ammonium transporter [Agromyces sp. CF514]
MDSGNLAWYLVAGAIVLFMTPGIAFFYGGMVKAKSVVSMMMMSFGAMGLVGVLWVLYGYNMGLMSPGEGNLIPGLLGNPFADIGLSAMASADDNGTLLAVFYGATFAIATTALVSGAIADRARFGPWMLFAGIWVTLVYFPVQGWVWGFDADGTPTGWIYALGDTLGFSTTTIDYAGGTAVHINAAAAALALALVLGKRIGFAKGAHQPHNVPLTLIGVAILIVGWFGFNGGAAATMGFDGLGRIILNTFVAAAAGILGWVLVERAKDGKATSIGAGSGAIAGLVAITPACYSLTPGWSILLGVIAGAACAFAIELKYKLGFDDSLDVVALHGIGGLIGCWFLGFFATDTGLIFSGNLEQLTVQVIASTAVAVYSFGITWLIGTGIEKTIGFRVQNADELAGVDAAQHGEDGYVLA